MKRTLINYNEYKYIKHNNVVLNTVKGYNSNQNRVL